MANVIPYGRQWITQDDIDAVTEVLNSDFLTQGPAIQKFEEAFAEYVGSKYAVAVANGTAALHLCALALDVHEGVNVITTPITFAASANCVRYAGGNVYFADVDPNTYLIDLNRIESLLKSKPKGFFSGIIPVDFAGLPVNMEQLAVLAAQYNCWILEDACHAPGGYFTDSGGARQLCGNGRYAELAIFSFHPVKHIACGEGGMITTNDEELYKKLQLLRTHGITKDASLMSENHGGWYYEMVELGYNYRLTDMQAALGLSQLKRADAGLQKRKQIAVRYDQAFKNAAFVTGRSNMVDGHAFHLYIIQVKERQKLYDFLRTRNIFCQVHYIPVHLQPYYRNLGWKTGDFPVAERYYSECLSLPVFPTLSEDDQNFVINSIFEFYEGR